MVKICKLDISSSIKFALLRKTKIPLPEKYNKSKSKKNCSETTIKIF